MNTHEFKIVYTRYSNCKRVISTPQFVQARNFRDAVSRANDRLEGMRQADPKPGAEFEIVSVEATGYHGVESADRVNGIFITADEIEDE